MKSAAILVFLAASLRAQFAPLAFLEGTWNAKTQQAAAPVPAEGTYQFVKELGGHILARHSSAADHADLLYIFPEGPSLKAIYFDNEGHVIHYSVSTPGPNTVEFLSDPAIPGPQFRLTYERKEDVMSGKFQLRMPGETAWKPYLEWSGSRQR